MRKQSISSCFERLLPAFVFCCSILASCSLRTDLSPEQKAAFLIAKSLDETISPVPSSQINESFFNRYGVSTDLRPQFATQYERLRKELDQVPEEHRQRQSVRYFLQNRFLAHSEDSLGDFNKVKYLGTPRNPIFMAFALRAEDLPDWMQIGNPNYIETLCRSFKVRENEMLEGIGLCLRRNGSFIDEAVALMIDKNLQDPRNGDPDFLFRNVLIPYLTYISKSKPLYAPLEQRVFAQYQIAFGKSRKENELRNFVNAFTKFLAGASMNVRFRNDLNATLARYRFRVSVHKRACVGYSILDYRIPIRRGKINDVVFLKKISVSLSLALLGSATTAERDVTINFDDIIDYAEDIGYTLEKKIPYRPLTSTAAPSWSELNTGFTLDSANKITAALLCREFGSESNHLILNRLIKKIALHEAKHKWDESIGADKGWYNVDCETSAYLTDALFGGTPLFSLLTFIYKYQDYYLSIEQEDLRDKIRPLLCDSWLTAQAAAAGRIDSSEVKERLRKVYASYVPIDGGALPDLEAFDRDIVKPCFRTLPEFDN